MPKFIIYSHDVCNYRSEIEAKNEKEALKKFKERGGWWDGDFEDCEGYEIDAIRNDEEDNEE